jgi:hypothetical protein
VQPWRVRRVEVPQTIARSFAHSTANDAAAFALTTEAAEARTARQWASVVFEGSPTVLRWCLAFGWRYMLRLKLAPPTSDDQMLGWAIAAGDLLPRSTALTAESRFLRASNLVAVEPSTVTWVTLVHYSHPAARPLWTITRPVHRLTMRYLLARAARTATPVASSSRSA